MNLLARVGSSGWVQGLRPVRCSRVACSRWLTCRQLEIRRVGVRMDDRWYCSYRCFRFAAQEHTVRLLRNPSTPQPGSSHSSLGMALVRSGMLTDEQYKQASLLKRKTLEDVGDVVVKLGFLSERQVAGLRAALWSCPVLPCSLHIERRGFQLPWFLIQRYAMLPLHYAASNGTLFIGFVYEVNYEALYAAELMLGCSTRACIIMPSEFTQRAMQLADSEPLHPCEAVAYQSSTEIIAAVCRSGVALDADLVRMVRCGDVLWCRLTAGAKSADLLFQTKDFVNAPRTYV